MVIRWEYWRGCRLTSRLLGVGCDRGGCHGINVWIGLLLIIPFNLAIVIISGIRARDYVRRTNAKGSFLYVVFAIIAVIVTACFVLVGIYYLGSGTSNY